MRAFLQVLGGDLLCKFFWGIANLALIRCLADEEFAQLSLVTAAFTVVVSGWFQNLYHLAVIGRQEASLAHRQSSFLALACLPLPILAVASYPLLSQDLGLAVPLVVWTTLAGVVEYCRTQYRLELKFARFTATEVVKTVTFCAAVAPWLLGWLDGLTAAAVLWFQAGATGLSLIVGGLRASWFTTTMHDVRELVRDLLFGPIRHVLGYFLLLAVLLRMDVFLLEWLAESRDVAVYGAAFRLLGFLGMALNAIHMIATPTLQQAKSLAALRIEFLRQFWIGAAFQPGLALVILTAGWWFPWIDGGRYPEAINVFRVLASGLTVGMFCSPAIHLLFRLRDYRFTFHCVASHLVLSLPIIAGAVTWGGAIGAAAGTSVIVASLNISVAIRAYHLMTHPQTELMALPTADSSLRAAA